MSESRNSRTQCAACKLHRRKCKEDCIIAPYLPASESKKYTRLHSLYGSSNLIKLLTDINPNQRAEAIDSLDYEAQQYRRDPAYWAAQFSYFEQKYNLLQDRILAAKEKLSANYIKSNAIQRVLSQQTGAEELTTQEFFPRSARVEDNRPQNLVENSEQFSAKRLELKLFEKQEDEEELIQLNRSDISVIKCFMCGDSSLSSQLFQCKICQSTSQRSGEDGQQHPELEKKQQTEKEKEKKTDPSS